MQAEFPQRPTMPPNRVIREGEMDSVTLVAVVTVLRWLFGLGVALVLMVSLVQAVVRVGVRLAEWMR